MDAYSTRRHVGMICPPPAVNRAGVQHHDVHFERDAAQVFFANWAPVPYTHPGAHHAVLHLVGHLLLEKKKKNNTILTH